MMALHNNRVGRLLGERVHRIQWAYATIFCWDAFNAHMLWNEVKGTVRWSNDGGKVANPFYDWGY